MKIIKKEATRYVLKLNRREALILAAAVNSISWESCSSEVKDLLSDLHEGLDGDYCLEYLGENPTSNLLPF